VDVGGGVRGVNEDVIVVLLAASSVEICEAFCEPFCAVFEAFLASSILKDDNTDTTLPSLCILGVLGDILGDCKRSPPRAGLCLRL
jgi:hypothetical protein